MNKRKPFHVPGSSVHRPPDKEYRTEHITIRLKVDLEEKSIAGSCILKVETLRDGLPSIRFDAAELIIARVKLDDADAVFEYDGRALVVWGNGPIRAAYHHVSVEYSARPRHGVYFVRPDSAYPEKPVQVWTQCESEAARFWFPCHDHPDDRSTTETIITAPDGYQVISTGKLVSQSSSGGWSTYHWSEAAPHSTYLNSFVVGKFTETADHASGVPIQYYVPEEKKADTMRCFGLTPDMMRIFVEVSGRDYPFEKYAQVAVHDFVYGGMENISATTMVDNRFPDKRTEEDYAVRYSRPDRNHVELVAHELAHSWFGDLITAKDWTHAWLNEGFATYMEAVYHERKYGKDEFRQNMQYKAAAHLEEDAIRYRRPIVENDYLYADDLFDTCAYEKSAWMLHQLRYLLGDGLFFKAVRAYVSRFAYKNPDTHDTMRLFEEATGLSLEAYFEQSFFKGGYPEFEVEYSWDEDRRLAEVAVAQIQAIDEETPVFQLPCDIVFYTDSGRQVKRVWVRTQQERYTFELESRPAIVEFDPEGWLLKKLTFRKSRSMLMNQVQSSLDALSRKQAAEDLAAFKDDEVVDVLKRAATSEQHWSSRAEAVRSIGKIGGAHALQTLVQLSGTKDRRVRRAVIAALGDFKGEPSADGLVREALSKDESPYIQCEAALSLAKLAVPDVVQVLQQAMNVPSPEHGLTEACLEGLGATKKEEVRATLRANLLYGKPTRVRVGALKGYAKLGSVVDLDRELLKDIALRESDFAVRNQSLMTIGELRDRRFADTLAKVAAGDPDNRNRRKAVEILVDFDSLVDVVALAEIKDQVERLRAENREINERLSRVEPAGQVPGR